jgi:uncharacterized protein involved in exopolysaccharide biosynthesis
MIVTKELTAHPLTRDPEERDISFLELVLVLLRYRRLILSTALLLPLILGIFILLRARTYTTTTTFAPQFAEGMPSGGLAGVAAQLGVPILSTPQGQSPAFYAELIESREIITPLVQNTYAFEHRNRQMRGTYARLNNIEASSDAAVLEKAVEHLRRRTDVARSREAGTITVRIRSRWPELAHAISVQLLTQINAFNLERRQSRAGAEKAFVEARLQNALDELRRAEDKLQLFLQQNRRFEGSPELTFQNERLQREVSLRQEVAVSLAQSVERARIEQVRDIPVITVLERPVEPVRPDRRRLVRRTGIAFVLGALFGVATAFILSFGFHKREGAAHQEQEFTRLVAQVRKELRRPWLLFSHR